MEGDNLRLRKALSRASGYLEAIATQLGEVDDTHLDADEWLHLRAQIGTHMAEFTRAVEQVDRIVGTTGARSRIIRYLQLRLNQTVTKEELSGVAGIYEWARRIRELRVDQGWAIQSSVTRRDLRAGEYVLELDHPDAELSRNWTVARQMRKLKTLGGLPSPKTRVLEFLKAIYPSSADAEQVAHVAGSAKLRDRCLAELADDGWSIKSGQVAAVPAEDRFALTSLEISQ
jgi:Helix-turn-helix domain